MSRKMDIPNHEAYVPNISKVAEAFQALGSDFRIDNTLNLDRRFSQFLAELNAIYQGSGE